MKNYIDLNKNKIVDIPGGKLCQVMGDDDGALCSIALVTMDANSKGIKHFHDNITEIYVFSKGNGSIVINENKNIINEGDCFILPPNNSHYIESKSNMNFICICTPPWKKDHEFEVKDIHAGKNIESNNIEGILQVLGGNINQNIKRIKINNSFKPNESIRKYTRIYYIIAGTGVIKNGEETINIKPNNCLKLNFENEIIFAKEKLDIILVCDKAY